MVAYSFKAQFAQPILDGTKGGTIRADRKRHARPGEELQLYTGMRTRQCRLIARRQCLVVDPVVLNMGRCPFVAIGAGAAEILCKPSSLDGFARFDGFTDWWALSRFWNEQHETDHFKGWHIRWLPLPAF